MTALIGLHRVISSESLAARRRMAPPDDGRFMTPFDHYMAGKTMHFVTLFPVDAGQETAVGARIGAPGGREIDQCL
ncbi:MULTISPECIES: hypothetical protein [Massilia]|uniref:Uncharacterized protein n=1 Tax=Massilia haematophila TaxID=457923 RepID=A0ABV7PF72_9BURK|nr:hypothetical protein [Massilia sp.]